MKNQICKISLFALILASSVSMPVDARVTVKSNNTRSHSEAYEYAAAIRAQQQYMNQNGNVVTTASDAGNLPVTVEDKKLADSILNNTAENVNMADLEACSMIYPTGVFKWAVPESGIRQNQTPQCVAVVELRDANSNAVLATTTLAAGDMMKCNIDMFPQNGWLSALTQVELPADEAPTLEQVEAVMNQEQKQNAGVKIAAGALITGIAANLLAPKAAGNDKLFGTNETALAATAGGLATGAGLAAASVYSGKVAGDTIKSTAVNAASGMVVGNMMAGASGSDDIVATTKCKTDSGEFLCVAGNLSKTKKGSTFADWRKDGVYINKDTRTVFRCENKKCEPQANILTNIYVKLKGQNESKSFYSLKEEDKNNIQPYVLNDDASGFVEFDNTNSEKTDRFYEVSSATITDGTKTHAYAVCSGDVRDKMLGYKDWDKELASKCKDFYYRNSDGSVGSKFEAEQDVTFSFEPSSRDASDGALVDLSNQARTKGTLIGTAAGGAMGGFAGYQGAKDEVTQRWLAEQRAYTDSLTNFYCATGTRFLSQYNSYAEIPNYTKSEQ